MVKPSDLHRTEAKFTKNKTRLLQPFFGRRYFFFARELVNAAVSF